MVGKPEAAFRQAVRDELLVVQQSKPSNCPLCRGKLENKGKRRRHVVSLRGEAEIERGYYQCQTCDQGYFPPGSAVRVEEHGLQSSLSQTDGVVKWDRTL